MRIYKSIKRSIKASQSDGVFDKSFKLRGATYYIEMLDDGGNYLAKWWDSTDNGLGYNNKGWVAIEDKNYRILNKIGDVTPENVINLLGVISEYDRQPSKTVQNRLKQEVAKLLNYDTINSSVNICSANENEASENYLVEAFYEDGFRGLADSEYVSDFDSAVDLAHEYISKGGSVRITNMDNGASAGYTYDEYFGIDDDGYSTFEGESPFRDYENHELWESIESSKCYSVTASDDYSDESSDLDYGFGFDQNGAAIDESTVEELCRVANEILAESELAKICNGNCEIPDHTWNYYATGTAFGASTDYTIIVKLNEDSINIYNYSRPDYEGIMLDFKNAYGTFKLEFEISVHSDEIYRVQAIHNADVYDSHGTFSDYYSERFNMAFDLDGICDWLKTIAQPVVYDIQSTVSNI